MRSQRSAAVLEGLTRPNPARSKAIKRCSQQYEAERGSAAAARSRTGTPNAARAVGAAVGKNPVSFVVPCHRVVGKSGDLTGYHWGITRKRAMLGWEAGQVGAA